MKIFLLAVFIFSIPISFLIAQTGNRKIVSTVSALKSAIQSAIPGDTIEVADGIYNFNGNISITSSGTEEYPIIIRSLNRGKAELTSKSYFTCKQVSFIVIEGFLFTSTDVTAVKTESCSNIRITRNIFRLTETKSLKWVLIGGTYNIAEPQSFNNRIDHNLFEEKHQLGNFITIDGSPDPNAKSSRNDRIDHNHFRNIGPRAANEMEAIRIGWSEMSLSSGNTTVEYNLFENCDGDPEIISVKTCDNVIRNNTFIECQGSVVLRHGNRNIVESNFFIGNQKAGTGGVRIYGDDHKIYNNYFEGLTGTTWDAAITITNGDADYPNSNLSKHFRPRRSLFAFNTLVNNAHNIEIGYTNNASYSRPPVDIFIANNIVVGNMNQLVKIISNPQNLAWQRNIMFPSGSAELGITALQSEIELTDPFLVLNTGYWKLSSASPAINSSEGVFDFVQTDIEGNERDQQKDIGADEYSFAVPLFRPLTPTDVGPDAEDKTIPVELISFTAVEKNGAINLNWQTASEINNYGFLIERKNLSGRSLYGYSSFEKLGFLPGKGTTTEMSKYSFIDNSAAYGNYIYRLKQIDYDGTTKYSEELKVSFTNPFDYDLYQNYPNPFNGSTIIKISVPEKSSTTGETFSLDIYDILGNKITNLINKKLSPGIHEILFDANLYNLSSGIYYYKFTAGRLSEIKKLILLK